MEHAFASVYLAPIVHCILDDGNKTPYTGSYGSEVSDISNITDVSLTIDNAVYVPFHAPDCSLRCIPTGITPGDVRCFYTIDGNTYGNIISISGKVAANTRYACEPEIDVTYNLNNAHVGDFYCKRSSDHKGYLIPGDVALINDQKQACVGIVMKVGKDDSGNWKDDCQYKLKDNSTPMNIIHGYVLALYDANDGSCPWGPYAKLGTDTEQYTGFYGYKNTQTIIKHGSNLQNNFPATYHATTGFESIYPAPKNSSGWFLPSAGQYWYCYQNRNVILTSMNKVGGNGWSGYYWSSSEDIVSPTYYVSYVSFFGKGLVTYAFKNYSNYVRSCLAKCAVSTPLLSVCVLNCKRDRGSPSAICLQELVANRSMLL